ncbi:MAG: pilus assembly FimT family protein [Patescibacteria group bacterium]
MLKKKSSGFTLIEILLVLTTIGVLAAIIIPVSGFFYNRNNLDLAVKQVVSDWRRAQSLARGAEADSNWGVYITSTSSVTFKGSSYISRDSAYDESENLNSLGSVSGLTEVVFYKATGTPITNGTIILNSINNESKNVSINSQGTISY